MQKGTRCLIILVILVSGMFSLSHFRHFLYAKLETETSDNQEVSSSSAKLNNEAGNITGLKSSWKDLKDEKTGLRLKVPETVYVKDYEGEMYNSLYTSELEDVNNDKSEPLMEIITVDSSNSSSSLNLLERFIFTKHGITNKNKQKVTNINDYEVAIIGFKPHIENDTAYFDVFAAVKVGNKGWVFVCNYTSSSAKNDSIDKTTSPIIESFLNILESIEPSDETDKVKFETLDDPALLIIQENRIINNKFKTTF